MDNRFFKGSGEGSRKERTATQRSVLEISRNDSKSLMVRKGIRKEVPVDQEKEQLKNQEKDLLKNQERDLLKNQERDLLKDLERELEDIEDKFKIFL